jgi:sugar lactone lactonase YvrE
MTQEYILAAARMVSGERPVSLAFGGADHKTLFIAAHSSLYSVHFKHSGR